MEKYSELFEKKIERIHRLIEQNKSKITWNDKIIDPDNPDRYRQIDITISRDGKSTAIECRIHKSPQDVQWIEELIGRKISLKFDALIAVSSSGFTKGAILKSKKYGIILRDLKNLSEDEIKKWGHRTKITINYFKLKNILIDVVFDAKHKDQIDLKEILNSFKENDIAAAILNAIKLQFGKIELIEFKTFSLEILTKDLYVREAEVIKIFVTADIKKIDFRVNIPSVVVYDDPEIAPLSRDIKIESTEFKNFEIIKNSKSYCSIIDLSSINHPPSCLLNHITFDMGAPLTLNSLQIIGYDKSILGISELKIRPIFVSAKDNNNQIFDVDSKNLKLKDYINFLTDQ